MNPLLMRAVVEALLFFELCDDDVLDPKVAVAQLEHLAQFIKRMTLEDRMAFARYTTELGLAEHRAHGDTPRGAALLSLSHDYYLVDAG